MSERVSWWAYSGMYMFGFFVALVPQFTAGVAGNFASGVVWAWLLGRWIGEHRDRRRGWRVEQRETEAGILVRVWVDKPQPVAGIGLMMRQPSDAEGDR